MHLARALIPQVIELEQAFVSAEAVAGTVAAHCPAFRFSRHSDAIEFNTTGCLNCLGRFTSPPTTRC